MEFKLLKSLVDSINECPDDRDEEIVAALNSDLAKDKSDFQVVNKNGKYLIKQKK